ncbi:MAG: precorrin-6A synthase (deacetylating) [Burkholderiaceae bacterium]|jgi:precorrin-6A synthase|nr:precorrin-6A synthase (deacetylating) [Burkholderiaceae bacterium]
MSAAPAPVALSLIGIGTGNPAHLTREAQAAMQAADLILLPHKGEDKAELAALRRDLCDAVLTVPGPHIAGFEMPLRRGTGDDYLAQVDEWHAAITRRWQEAIAAALADGLRPRLPGQALRVALLVWGDPALYDSTLRIAARMQPAPLSVSVVAGISSMQVLCAAHAIALNGIGQPFVVTTGRQLREQGWPPGVDTAVVMLDGQCSFTGLASEGLSIWWGAYLGMDRQMLDSGPLAQAGPRIVAARAQARERHGWIMDIYLLRRGG